MKFVWVCMAKHLCEARARRAGMPSPTWPRHRPGAIVGAMRCSRRERRVLPTPGDAGPRGALPTRANSTASRALRFVVVRVVACAVAAETVAFDRPPQVAACHLRGARGSRHIVIVLREQLLDPRALP